jgi:hypothetical protein
LDLVQAWSTKTGAARRQFEKDLLAGLGKGKLAWFRNGSIQRCLDLLRVHEEGDRQISTSRRALKAFIQHLEFQRPQTEELAGQISVLKELRKALKGINDWAPFRDTFLNVEVGASAGIPFVGALTVSQGITRKRREVGSGGNQTDPYTTVGGTLLVAGRSVATGWVPRNEEGKASLRGHPEQAIVRNIGVAGASTSSGNPFRPNPEVGVSVMMAGILVSPETVGFRVGLPLFAMPWLPGAHAALEHLPRWARMLPSAGITVRIGDARLPWLNKAATATIVALNAVMSGVVEKAKETSVGAALDRKAQVVLARVKAGDRWVATHVPGLKYVAEFAPRAGKPAPAAG